MNFFRRLSLHLPLACGALVLTGPMVAPTLVLAQAAAQAPDAADLDRASALIDEGKLDDAAKALEEFPNKYSTSPLVPASKFQLGYVYFRQNQYDKAIPLLQEVEKQAGVTPEVVQRALSLLPQVVAAKASGMKTDDPKRTSTFEEAVKLFDAFLAKFPNSDEAESANYGKAISQYQIAKYEEAIAALKANLQRFPRSETILDSKYLLALTTGTLATTNAQKGGNAAEPAVAALYDEAVKLLTEIINSRLDIALLNDSLFQTGEVIFARAQLTEGDALKKPLFDKALESFRRVLPKDIIVTAQEARIAQLRQRRTAALQQRDMATYGRLPRVINRESEKLDAIKAREDQTLTAKLKMGQIFFQQGQMDAARVVLKFVSQFTESDSDKKDIKYYTALSLAAQNADARGANKALAEQTKAAYDDFRSAYKGDPAGENLAVVVGSGFLESDPETATKFFKDSAEDYPKGRFVLTALAQQGSAQLQLQQYDAAVETFKKVLSQTPPKDVAANAEYGIANAFQQTKKLEEAMTAYKAVRDKYPGTEQAEQGAFWYGQLAGEAGKFDLSAQELEGFLKNYPQSKMQPAGMYYLATAQAGLQQKEKALATYKELAEKHKDSEVAPLGFFQSASLLQADGKNAEVIALLQEFAQKYPNHKELFRAVDLTAQLQALDVKPDDAASSAAAAAAAVKTYEEFVASHKEDPNAPEALLRVTNLWRGEAEKIGRYVALDANEKKRWEEGMNKAIASAERVVTEYSESPQVSLALKSLLEIQRQRAQGKIVTTEDVEKYFQNFQTKFEGQASTKSKVTFAQAAFIFEKDKKKAVDLMSGAYNSGFKYAPSDMDLYGAALTEQKKYEEADAVFKKLAADYPLPEGTAPQAAPAEVQEAQAIAVFGQGKILQEQKNTAEAQKFFKQLETDFPRSPKMMEASYGIALSDYQQKKLGPAQERLRPVMMAGTATAELRAKAMLLMGRCLEDEQKYDLAIGNYLKIASFYGGVPAVAAEGLFRGAQLLEKQAAGQIPLPKPAPAKAPAKK